MGSAVDAVTGDIFDFDKSKKKLKEQERKMQEQIDRQNRELEKKKKDSKDKTLGFYESLRGGNLSMLKPSENQIIGW